MVIKAKIDARDARERQEVLDDLNAMPGEELSYNGRERMRRAYHAPIDPDEDERARRWLASLSFENQ